MGPQINHLTHNSLKRVARCLALVEDPSQADEYLKSVIRQLQALLARDVSLDAWTRVTQTMADRPSRKLQSLGFAPADLPESDFGPDTLMVYRRNCPKCDVEQEVQVSSISHAKWMSGMLIQKAMRQLSDAQREVFLSGVCSSCWEEHGDG